MSPVTLAELDPKSRALALQQIGETQGTTALATVKEQSSLTLNDPASMTDGQLADIVIDGVKKFRRYLPYVFALKARFAAGERDSKNRLKIPIKDCYSWQEFCEGHLDHTARAVSKALAPKPAPAPEPSPAPTPKPVACTCPDCGQSFPSKGQLRRHGQSEHNISSEGIANFLRRASGEPAQPAVEETHWISKENHCPTGKRGFDYPDDLWQLMRAEGTIGETDFIAYIGTCGQCGRCHRDKDQSGHEADAVRTRHQTWYRPDELNQQPEPAPQPINDAEFVDATAPQPAPEPAPEPKPERTLEAVLDKLVERIALQQYGYSAAKFKLYPEQHTTDLAIIELAKEEIWHRIVEIGQAKLIKAKEDVAIRTSLENIG